MKRFLFFASILITANLILAQTIKFEDIAPVPNAEVRSIYISPLEELYVITLSNELIFSNDLGQSWTQLPGTSFENPEIDRVDFLESGVPIIMYRDRTLADEPRLLGKSESGNLKNILPPAVEEFRYWRDLAVHKESIYIYNEGLFYKSTDIGESYNVIAQTDTVLNHDQLLVTGEFLLLHHVVADGITEKDVLNIYDLSGNLIKVLDLEFQGASNGNTIEAYVDEKHWLFYDTETDLLHYTFDEGLNFFVKDIGGGQKLGHIGEGYFYFRCSGDRCRILLDESFQSNPIETLAEQGEFYLFDQYKNYGIAYKSFSEYSITNHTTGETWHDLRSSFPSSLVTEFHIRKNGGIVANVRDKTFFESNDDGASWNYLGSIDFYRFDNSPFALESAISYTEESVIACTPDGVIEFFSNGIQEKWDLDFFDELDSESYYVSCKSNGKYRLVMSACDRMIYFSQDFEPFQQIQADSEFCFEISFRETFITSKLIDDHFFIYNSMTSSSSDLMVLDLSSMDLSVISEIDSVEQPHVARYGIHLTDIGEILVHPYIENGFFPIPDSFPFLSFYTEHYTDPLEFVSLGLLGAITFDEVNRDTYLLGRNRQLYVRSEIDSQFEEINILNRNFGRMRAMIIDSNQRLMVQVDHKRILRADISQITRTESIVHPIEDFLVYPNPASDILTVSIEKVKEVDIYSIDGFLVFSDKVDTNLMISIQELNSGLYLIVGKTKEGGRLTTRFVKD